MRRAKARFRKVAVWAAVGAIAAGMAACVPQGGEEAAVQLETINAGRHDALRAGDIAAGLETALAAWLPGELTAREVPGAAVAIVGSDQIYWEATYGALNDTESPSVTPDTLFNIRSISKSVTALAVLMAVQDGLVDLDAPITDYLPEFTVNTRFEGQPESRMTLRHLLSHQAGFTHDPPFGLDMSEPDYFERYIESISESWLRTPVGYQFHYANYGFDLAGYILQERSGVPFEDYVRERVLEPLGMSDSTFDLEAAARAQNRAVGHNTRGADVPVPLPEIPAAGLYASVRDMARYAQFHLNDGMVDGRRLLRADLMAQYHAIQFPRPGQRTGYAFGLIREPVGDTLSLYHEGGGRGYGSVLVLYPDLGVAAVILTNREYHGLTGFEGRTFMNGPVINRVGPRTVSAPDTARMDRLAVDDPRVTAVLGRYGDSPGVVVGYEHGVLGLRFSEARFAPLTAYDDGGELVGLYGSATEVRFLPAVGDRPGALMWVSRVFDNPKISYSHFNDGPSGPPGPDRPGWAAFGGDYDTLWEDEPVSQARVEVRNGRLYFNDGQCVEHAPGLFFRYDGEALDFRTDPPTFARQALRRSPPPD
jgi:CubicO group peptidase (beta-lactamase class C family)